jgi:hypothetical protein
MITTAKQLYDFLEDTYGPSVRHIHVKRLPNGRKLPMDENSSYTREQIEANRGNPSSNCLSIYLKYTTGLVVLDFDQKEGLHQSGLWNLCVQRDYLRCETNGGWHVYIQCAIPDGACEILPLSDADYAGEYKDYVAYVAPRRGPAAPICTPNRACLLLPATGCLLLLQLLLLQLAGGCGDL